MTEILPIPPAAPYAAAADPALDAVLAARAVSDGEYIAGLILAAELDTVGSPRKLPQDVWPDEDAALIQEVFQRGVAVGFRAGRFFSAPRFYRDKLVSLQRRLSEAGYAAMGRSVGPAVAVAHRAPD
jgi:hypothetical protein